MVDSPGGDKYVIHVYSRVGTGWRASQITTTREVHRVSLAPSGDCLCGSPDEVMLYNKRGEMLWSIPLPGEGRLVYLICVQLTQDKLSSVIPNRTKSQSMTCRGIRSVSSPLSS